MENLENQCLEKLNKILSKFDLQIVIIKVNQLNQRQCRLVYKNDTVNWLALWLSISDMLFERTTIFECLNSYYIVLSTPKYNRPDICNDRLSKFQACSAAYKEIEPLKSSSFEEFLINCDLMGV